MNIWNIDHFISMFTLLKSNILNHDENKKKAFAHFFPIYLLRLRITYKPQNKSLFLRILNVLKSSFYC